MKGVTSDEWEDKITYKRLSISNKMTSSKIESINLDATPKFIPVFNAYQVQELWTIVFIRFKVQLDGSNAK